MYDYEYVDQLESKLIKLEDMIYDMQIKIYKLENMMNNNSE